MENWDRQIDLVKQQQILKKRKIQTFERQRDRQTERYRERQTDKNTTQNSLTVV